MVDRALCEQRPEDPFHHIVQPALRNKARLQRRLHRGRAEPWLVANAAKAGELIEPVVGRRGRMDRSPVAHHEALVAPVALQHFVEEVVVLAAPAAVDEIVGAHHGARTSAFDREFEREQIRLAHRLRGNGDVQSRPLGFGVVHGVMLDRRDDVVRLDAVDQRTGHGAGEKRVLSRIFEVAAVPRLARKVHAA